MTTSPHRGRSTLDSGPMPEIRMNKAIHGAVRRDLDRFISALGTFPQGDPSSARQLSAAWANFDDQLTVHHEGERTIAWPGLQAAGISKELLATLDTER